MRNINSTLLFKKRTSVFIAHKLKTVADAGMCIAYLEGWSLAFDVDLIIVLADGTVAEQGTHQELLRNDSVYAKCMPATTIPLRMLKYCYSVECSTRDRDGRSASIQRGDGRTS